jgi:hypothetical protein
MIALETLSIVAGMALASYTLSILLLYKNKDKDRLGKTKEPTGKPFALSKQFPTSTKNQGIMK